ncbi:hypothetical protein THRCLA_08801 [Thraustotheca clavata]|uniref:Uncharacterized protein n=1 Tax=Thraustotheca clavata TaxID=74557 RepID=A0A1V9Z2E1_9STRA|nr:hypothetical protein THRCLA_08801 [Thraustotheca clavata]
MNKELRYASTVEMQTKHWFGLTTWKYQNWSLRGDTLTISHASIYKRKEASTYHCTIKHGGIWRGHKWGIFINTVEYGELYACATGKTSWAMWLNALLALDTALAMKSRDSIASTVSDFESVSPLTKRVSFNDSVRVRTFEHIDHIDEEIGALPVITTF